MKFNFFFFIAGLLMTVAGFFMALMLPIWFFAAGFPVALVGLLLMDREALKLV